MIEKCNNAKNPLTARLFGDKQSLIGKKNFHPVFVTQAFTMAETLIVVIVLGIILAFTIRKESCLMFLPLFFPIFIYKTYGNKEKVKDNLL